MTQQAADQNEIKGTKPADLAVPEGLQYSADHVWVDDADGLVTIGITEYAANQMGDLVYLDMPEVGDQVRIGDEVVEMESAKAVQSLVCPVEGTVRYVNRAVADDPQTVNDDPYEEGWMLKIEQDGEADLMDGDQYAALVARQ